MSNRHKHWNLVVLAALLLGLLPLAAMAQPAGQADWAKVDPALLERVKADGQAGFVIILTTQADLSGAAALPTKAEKTAYVFWPVAAGGPRDAGPAGRLPALAGSDL